MSTATLRYKPLLFSEKVAPNGAGKYTMCRGASLAMAYDAATNGNWTTNPDGSRWGRAKIKAMLDKMRLATGEPLRDGYNQGHVPEFLKAMGAPPDTWEQANVTWQTLMGDLRTGFVVELAGNVVHTPANSPLRKYVNPVDHDILLVAYKDGRVAFIDPMTPHGTRRYVRWAPSSDVQAFGSEFRTGGTYIAGRIKRGKYSDLAIQRRTWLTTVDKLDKRIDGLLEDLERLRKENTDLGRDVALLEQEIVSLQTQAENCMTEEEFAIVLQQVGVIEGAATAIRDIIN